MYQWYSTNHLRHFFVMESTNTIDANSSRRRHRIVDTTPSHAVDVVIHHAEEVRQRFAKILSERSLCSDPSAFREVDEGTAIRGLKCEITSVLSAAEGQSKRNRRHGSLPYNLDDILEENERALSLAQTILDKKSKCKAKQCLGDESSFEASNGKTFEPARSSHYHSLKEEGAKSTHITYHQYERSTSAVANIEATHAA